MGSGVNLEFRHQKFKKSSDKNNLKKCVVKYGKIPKHLSRHRWCLEDALWASEVALCPLGTQFQTTTMLLLWWALKHDFKTPFGNRDAWPKMSQRLFPAPLDSIILVRHLLVSCDVSSIALSLCLLRLQEFYHIIARGRSEHRNQLSKIPFDLPSVFSLRYLCTPYAQMMTPMLPSFPLLS